MFAANSNDLRTTNYVISHVSAIPKLAATFLTLTD